MFAKMIRQQFVSAVTAKIEPRGVCEQKLNREIFLIEYS